MNDEHKTINEEPKKKAISVDEEKLNQMVEELVATRKQNAELAQRLERVEAASDKGRLAHFDSQHKEKQYKRVHLTGWNGKVVLAWQMVVDVVEQNPINGLFTEKQIVKLFLDDKSTEEVNIRDFSRKKTAVWGDVVKDVTDDVTKQRILTVKLDDNKGQHDIAVTFVNY